MIVREVYYTITHNWCFTFTIELPLQFSLIPIKIEYKKLYLSMYEDIFLSGGVAQDFGCFKFKQNILGCGSFHSFTWVVVLFRSLNGPQ